MKKLMNIQSISSPKGSLAVWMAAFKEKHIFMDSIDMFFQYSLVYKLLSTKLTLDLLKLEKEIKKRTYPS